MSNPIELASLVEDMCLNSELTQSIRVKSIIKKPTLTLTPTPTSTVESASIESNNQTVAVPAKRKKKTGIHDLPMELILIIVDEVREVEAWQRLELFTIWKDGKAMAPSWQDSLNPMSEKDLIINQRRNLSGLSGVNREFNELCEQTMWKALVMIDNRSPDRTQILNEDIGPRHGSLVERVYFSLPSDFLLYNELRVHYPKNQDISYLKPEELQCDEYLFPALVSHMIKDLPKLEYLTLSEPNDLDQHEDPDEIHRVLNFALLQMIPSIASSVTLKHLELSHMDCTSIHKNFIQRLLDQLPNLESLSLHAIEFVPESLACERLGQSISKITNLKNLSITSTDCVDAAWRKFEWSGSIVDLRLEGFNFKGETDYKVIDHIAPNVVKLILAPDSPIDDWIDEMPNQHVYNLPNLVSLELKTWCEDLAPRFQYCKSIEKLHTIMNLQRHSNWEIIPILICAKSWPNLSSLILQNSSEFMINFFDTQGLGAFCHKRKIHLMA